MSDDIKALWQKQETEYAPMPLEEIRKRAKEFHSRTLWHNAIGYVANVLVALGFGYYIWAIPIPLVRIGSALIVIAAFYVSWQMQKRITPAPPPAEASAAT